MYSFPNPNNHMLMSLHRNKEYSAAYGQSGIAMEPFFIKSGIKKKVEKLGDFKTEFYGVLNIVLIDNQRRHGDSSKEI